MSVEGESLGRGVSIAASPTAFFEHNMNIVSIIKAADVRIGPPVMVGGGIPILQQAEAVASAAWSKFEVPKAFHTALADVNLDPGLEPAVPDPAQQFFENNVRILSIMPHVRIQLGLNATDAVSEAESILKQAAQPAITKPAVEQVVFPLPKLKVDTKPQIMVQPETKTVPKTVQDIVAAPVQEQVLEEVILLDKQVDQPAEAIKTQAQQEEKKQKVIAWHVIDLRAVARRINIILTQASRVVREKLNGQKIKGVDLTKGLAPSNKQEVRGGEINRKDPEELLADKTWDATLEQLERLEFDSPEQIKAQVPAVVLDNHPVIIATKGEVASDKNVARSHQNQRASRAHLVFEIRKRLKRQQNQIIVQEEKQITEEEDSIQVHPELAEALGEKSALTDFGVMD